MDEKVKNQFIEAMEEFTAMLNDPQFIKDIETVKELNPHKFKKANLRLRNWTMKMEKFGKVFRKTSMAACKAMSAK